MPDDHAPDGGLETAERLAAEALVVDVDGFEGPLDLLLTLSRTQKVDLRRISVLALAEQYLRFVEEAKRLRIELAADYLVMAAWLAFLKSRLLLPPDPQDQGPSGEDLAAHLAFQLERLEAMRRAAAQIMGRDQLGRDFFARGETQSVSTRKKVVYQSSLLELMQAYARIKTREDFEPLHLKRGPIYTMEQALERMRGLIGTATEWGDIERFLPEGWQVNPKKRRSALASTFAATLEMAKTGQIELRQNDVFGRLELRAKGGAA
ncbi:MAG: ScpA family protein [Pseudomonadota bacterium]